MLVGDQICRKPSRYQVPVPFIVKRLFYFTSQRPPRTRSSNGCYEIVIYNTTYFDKEIRDEINTTLGNPYGLLDVLKLGTIGSSRMIIPEESKRFVEFTQQNQDITYASIELRPKGILVYISKSYHTLSWTIPYHQLTLYKTEHLTLHCNGEFLRLKIRRNQNKSFIKKVQDLRVTYLQQYSFP